MCIFYFGFVFLFCCFFFFFFQADDGIRDIGVTGVQTCALPISRVRPSRGTQRQARPTARVDTELGGGKEGGERRRAGDGTVGGRADLPAGEKSDAADAARQKAEKLGVDLSQVEGCGARGRITAKEVVSAANRE